MSEASEPSLSIKIKETVSRESATSEEGTKAETTYVEKDLEIQLKKEAILTQKSFNLQLEQNREERKKYARHIFKFTCWWAGFILFFFGLSGFKKFTQFDASDKVLIALITSTTVNCFGFFLLVVKYLFHTNEKKEAKKDKKKKNKKKPNKKSD